MELTEFLLARVAEEEHHWSSMTIAAPDLAGFATRMVGHCHSKQALIEAYLRHRDPHVLRELQELALPYYDHEDYRDDWRPPHASRWLE